MNDRLIGRMAPSPTGRMHMGNVYALAAAWAAARSRHGRVLLRIEDIDAPRVRRDADKWIMDDLAWLGLDWDGAPVYQSDRLDLYERALETLRARGLVYPCFCSRADIRAASAPNEGDGFLVYPGTCRRLDPAVRRGRLERGDRHSWRIAVPESTGRGHVGGFCIDDCLSGESNGGYRDISSKITFNDLVFGGQSYDLSTQVGDVVIRRSDGLFAYQLAATVDDLLMGVTQIVRGRDLLRSTAIQLWIRRALCDGGFGNGGTGAIAKAATEPEFGHLPLIDSSDGRRMAKRLNSLDMGTIRESGVTPRQVLGRCAWLLGLTDGAGPRPMTPAELVAAFSWPAVAAHPSDKIVDMRDPFPD